MYVPKHFAETDPDALNGCIRASNFASLVMSKDGIPLGTHLPLYLDADKGAHGTLLGHLARANDHWQLFDGETPALAIFTGINAYIGPNWYKSENTVPTWNYLAIHAYGKPRIIHDTDEVLGILERLTLDHESDATGHWTADKMDQKILHGMLKGIVAFEMPIDRIEGNAKLGQNKKPEDTEGAVNGLRATDNPMAHKIASAMEDHLKP
jgi:transcriptional regulator